MTQKTNKARQSSCAHAVRSAPEPINWLAAIGLFWLPAILGAALDLWSKAAVFAWLEQKHPPAFSIIDGFLQFIMRQNTGAAFSAFEGRTLFLVSISCVALVVVIGIFFSRKINSKTALFALGCITAGIVGNLYDRLFNDGRVRDFIDVYIGASGWHWPTFNVADSLLCIGVGLLIFVNLRSSHQETEKTN